MEPNLPVQKSNRAFSPAPKQSNERPEETGQEFGSFLNEASGKPVSVVKIGDLTYRIKTASDEGGNSAKPESGNGNQSDSEKKEPQNVEPQAYLPLGSILHIQAINPALFLSKLTPSLRSFITETVEIIRKTNPLEKTDQVTFKFDNIPLHIRMDVSEGRITITVSVTGEDKELLRDLNKHKQALTAILQQEFPEDDLHLLVIGEPENRERNNRDGRDQKKNAPFQPVSEDENDDQGGDFKEVLPV